jgi:hypothetical protein
MGENGGEKKPYAYRRQKLVQVVQTIEIHIEKLSLKLSQTGENWCRGSREGKTP